MRVVKGDAQIDQSNRASLLSKLLALLAGKKEYALCRMPRSLGVLYQSVLMRLHVFLKTYLAAVLGSTRFLSFSEGFRVIEAWQHAELPSVIREMRGCYLVPDKGDVVVDVGANFGFYSLLASRLVGEEGLVLAFEPETTNYNIFVANLRLNGVTNVKTFRMALADFDGEARLYLSEHPGTHSMVLARGSRFETVKVRKLDMVLEGLEIGKISLIKLDAEGAELGILRGALGTISKHKPNLTVASYHYANEVDDIEEFLKENAGFYHIVRTKNPGEGDIIHAISRYNMER
jgi:FkbM family methyltransferase